MAFKNCITTIIQLNRLYITETLESISGFFSIAQTEVVKHFRPLEMTTKGE